MSQEILRIASHQLYWRVNPDVLYILGVGQGFIGIRTEHSHLVASLGQFKDQRLPNNLIKRGRQVGNYPVKRLLMLISHSYIIF